MLLTGQGNLSYVVNGGFSRFPAYPLVWVGYAAMAHRPPLEPRPRHWLGCTQLTTLRRISSISRLGRRRA